MAYVVARTVITVRVTYEKFVDLRVLYRRASSIRQKVLLGDVRDIGRFLIFGQKVIKRLVLNGPNVLGNGLVPFLGVIEFRVDVEYDPAKRIYAMVDNLAYLEFRCSNHVIQIRLVYTTIGSTGGQCNRCQEGIRGSIRSPSSIYLTPLGD